MTAHNVETETSAAFLRMRAAALALRGPPPQWMRPTMRLFRLLVLVLFVVAASAQNNNARDALFTAIQRGSIADVERLLKTGVSASLTDAEGTPALMAAALFADARMMELLLQHGADANQPGPSGTTALMWAVPDLAKVRLLVTHGANVNARPENDRTALLVAASYPQTVDLLRLLLEHGADLHAQDKGGATALALSLRSADVEVVRFLVERGLDPNALAPAAQSAGLARHDPATANYLISQLPKPFPNVLNIAATWQPVPLIARWIELGADVNTTNAAQYARTPVLTAVASETESTDTLKLLLDRGADPNARMTEGESALDLAIYKGDRAKIELLERYGAKRGNGPRQEEIAPPPKGGIQDPRTSLGRSVARLLDAAPTFREKTNCISCHHNAMPALATATVRRKGVAFLLSTQYADGAWFVRSHSFPIQRYFESGFFRSQDFSDCFDRIQVADDEATES